jgi:hypothetical protein
MTSRVIGLVREGKLDVLGYLERHLAGDWGDLLRHEKHANDAALAGGHLFVSRFNVFPDVRLVIVTRLERQLTKLMLLCEFLDDIDD